jgi:hypothetical protein
VNEDPYCWDERVEAWKEVATSDVFLAIRDRIVELAEPQREDRVVDLGAGTGLRNGRATLRRPPVKRELQWLAA